MKNLRRQSATVKIFGIAAYGAGADSLFQHTTDGMPIPGINIIVACGFSFCIADGAGWCRCAIDIVPAVTSLGNTLRLDMVAHGASVGLFSLAGAGRCFDNRGVAVAVIRQTVIDLRTVTAKGANLLALSRIDAGGLANYRTFIIMILRFWDLFHGLLMIADGTDNGKLTFRYTGGCFCDGFFTEGVFNCVDSFGFGCAAGFAGAGQNTLFAAGGGSGFYTRIKRVCHQRNRLGPCMAAVAATVGEDTFCCAGSCQGNDAIIVMVSCGGDRDGGGIVAQLADVCSHTGFQAGCLSRDRRIKFVDTFFRTGHEADCDDSCQSDGSQGNPKARLAVAEYTFDTVL